MKGIRIIIWALLGFSMLMANPQRQVDEIHQVEKNAKITISNVSGEVKVMGWGKNEVKITGKLEKDVKKLSVDGNRSHLSIKVEIEKKRHTRAGSAYLTIYVPQRARLEVETVSAEISVSKLQAEYGEFSSVSGEIISDCKIENLTLQTVSGGIECAGKGKELKTQSVSGSIHIDGDYPIMRAGSVSGSVEIETGDFKDGNFQTTSGSIEFKGHPHGSGQMKLKSISGSVILYLPEHISADFDLSTFSGQIDNDLTNNRVEKNEMGPGADLEFTLGKGDFRIRASSFSGSVKLRRK